jgi:hypothetical protein
VTTLQVGYLWRSSARNGAAPKLTCPALKLPMACISCVHGYVHVIGITTTPYQRPDKVLPYNTTDWESLDLNTCRRMGYFALSPHRPSPTVVAMLCRSQGHTVADPWPIKL